MRGVPPRTTCVHAAWSVGKRPETVIKLAKAKSKAQARTSIANDPMQHCTDRKPVKSLLRREPTIV
jgi:hypothetical protein